MILVNAYLAMEVQSQAVSECDTGHTGIRGKGEGGGRLDVRSMTS